MGALRLMNFLAVAIVRSAADAQSDQAGISSPTRGVGCAGSSAALGTVRACGTAFFLWDTETFAIDSTVVVKAYVACILPIAWCATE